MGQCTSYQTKWLLQTLGWYLGFEFSACSLLILPLANVSANPAAEASHIMSSVNQYIISIMGPFTNAGKENRAGLRLSSYGISWGCASSLEEAIKR